MSTVTISSGVHVGQRPEGDPGDFIDWFAATTTAQFSTFTFSASTAPKTSAQRISGHASLTGAPIEFGVDRRARNIITDHLASIAAQELLGGRPRATLSGFRDAAIRSGFLVNAAWSERDNSGGSARAFNVWGVIVVNDATVSGLNERLSVTLWPCDAAFWIGTRNWFLTPTAYASLSGS